MATNPNANTPTPGTGASLGAAASSIANLLSDDFTIGETQDNGETREPKSGKGKPDDESRQEPEQHDEGEQPGSDKNDDEHDESDEHSGEHDGEDDEQDESDEQDTGSGIKDDTEVTVEIDGKAEKVTVGELKKGYLRQADYTRKTQALATERQEFQREQTETREERAKLKQGLEQVAFLFQQLTPKRPTQAEWDALHAQDPQEWVRVRELWRSWDEQWATIQQQYAEVQNRATADAQKSLKDRFMSEKNKLVEAIPEWSDPKVAKAEKDMIRELAYSLGYTPEDIANTVDHRIFVMARKAALYDKMMKTKGSLKPGAPVTTTKVVRPGTQGTKPTNRTAVNEAKQRLAKTGNVRDAAALLEKLI